MSEYDYEDVYKVPVDFTIVKSAEEEFIQKKMVEACKDGSYWEFGLCSYYKLNLTNPKDKAYNNQMRTYFACTTQQSRVLVRYDANLKLQHVGGYRKGKRFCFFDVPLPYTPAPQIEEIALEPPPPAKAYKMKINPDTNLISSHPFTESQMKFTYAHINNFSKALQKNEKFVLQKQEYTFQLHGIDETYDGMLVRFITPDTAHYFKCEKPGQGKSGHWSVFTIENGWLKKWSPKKHLPKLKEITM